MNSDRASVAPEATPSRGGTPIRVVLFDLDDTLFSHRRSAEAGIRAYLIGLGEPYASADADAAVALWNDLEHEHYDAYLAGTLDHAGQRRERAMAFAAAHGVTVQDDWEDWFAGFTEHYVRGWALFDDALPCLKNLRDSMPWLRLGIVTNGDAVYQYDKVERLGLAPFFEHVISSGEVGVAKPDSRIFGAACTRFGVPASAAAYVGDRLATDAIAAAEAGLTGIWLNRSGSVADGHHRAQSLGVVEIASLESLASVILSPAGSPDVRA